MVLDQLKLTQLRRLAIAVGSLCSGTKSSITRGILNELQHVPSLGTCGRKTNSPGGSIGNLRVLSIDMGVQNLAYAYMTTSNVTAANCQRLGDRTDALNPVVHAWNRLSVFSPDGGISASPDSGNADYSAAKYAAAAYSFITRVIEKYDPTHVLIEQQRFRSGGSSAVLEWTLRVGVFEGMLHAILRTLKEQQKDSFCVQEVASISPARTARFWLAGAHGDGTKTKKTTGREGKQAKIDIVGHSLHKGQTLFTPSGQQATAMAEQFLQRWRNSKNGTGRASKIAKTKGKSANDKPEEMGRAASDDLSAKPNLSYTVQPIGSEAPQSLRKLDDLSDCLLQGLAWLQWIKARNLVSECLSTNTPVVALEGFLKGND